jgi:hypothetical protein
MEKIVYLLIGAAITWGLYFIQRRLERRKTTEVIERNQKLLNLKQGLEQASTSLEELRQFEGRLIGKAEAAVKIAGRYVSQAGEVARHGEGHHRARRPQHPGRRRLPAGGRAPRRPWSRTCAGQLDGDNLAAFEQVHLAWLAFRERYARFIAQSYSAGAIQPLIHAVTRGEHHRGLERGTGNPTRRRRNRSDGGIRHDHGQRHRRLLARTPAPSAGSVAATPSTANAARASSRRTCSRRGANSSTGWVMPKGRWRWCCCSTRSPRNVFRRSGHAFATDGLARHYATRALTLGFDTQVDVALRAFFYLPFEHSEAWPTRSARWNCSRDCPATTSAGRNCTTTSSSASAASRTAMRRWTRRARARNAAFLAEGGFSG